MTSILSSYALIHSFVLIMPNLLKYKRMYESIKNAKMIESFTLNPHALTWLNSCKIFWCRTSVCDRTSEPASDTQFCMRTLTSFRCCSNLSISTSFPSVWPSTAGAFWPLWNDASFTSSSLSSLLACTYPVIPDQYLFPSSCIVHFSCNSEQATVDMNPILVIQATTKISWIRLLTIRT